jgi:hypothetical protein
MRPAPPLITCEHGGNDVPAEYAELFRGREAMLQSHRGYDRGALRMARDFASDPAAGGPQSLAGASQAVFGSDAGPVPGRAPEDPRPPPSPLPEPGRALHPGPDRRRAVRGSCVLAQLHTGHGRTRPQRRRGPAVRSLAAGRTRPGATLAPADGLITHLRRLFPADRYVGIELEVNQRYPQEGGSAWNHLRRILVESLDDALR